jgi:hypothetical protein
MNIKFSLGSYFLKLIFKINVINKYICPFKYKSKYKLKSLPGNLIINYLFEKHPAKEVLIKIQYFFSKTG